MKLPSKEFTELVDVIADIPREHNRLFADVHEELGNARYIHLRHGERHTRNQGCKGPLCKKSLRDATAERVRQRNEQMGRSTRVHARSELYVAIDPMLVAVKLAHDRWFDAVRNATPEELQTAGVAA